jgi:hypothetical protein
MNLPFADLTYPTFHLIWVSCARYTSAHRSEVRPDCILHLRLRAARSPSKHASEILTKERSSNGRVQANEYLEAETVILERLVGLRIIPRNEVS